MQCGPALSLDEMVELSDRPSTTFQRLITGRMHAAVEWLLRSIAACGDQGSAVYYSRWYRPLRGWMYPYPETTGYIIPTLIEYGKFADRPDCIAIALRQADWIMSLQYDDGGLPGSHIINGRRLFPSIFNTAQMILGLVAAADQTGNAKYLASATRAARWLADSCDRDAHTWTSHAYVKTYSPSYNSRVCWPMLEVDKRAPDETVRRVAVAALRTITTWQLANGAFENWGFKPNRPGFTHTIAYTIRGLLESGRLLGEPGREFVHTAIKSANVFRRRFELRGKLAGAYDRELNGQYWYSCLTGNCQMALIWMKLADHLDDARYLSAALKVLQPVIERQRMRHLDPNVRGAIPGSSPLWGRYLTLRYPNWAAKFYIDALLLAHRQLQQLLEHGPCELPSLRDSEKACIR